MSKRMDIDASEDVIQNIFSKKSRYTVPDYQRPYSWKEQQWTDFWNDLNSIPSNETHFLGSVVLIKHDSGWKSLDKLEVVDGQQRLTTISIVLCAMRDRYKELGNPNELVEFIESNYLFEYDDDNEKHSKITLSRYDKEDYKRLLDGRYGAIDSDSKILESLEFFQEKLSTEDKESLDVLRKKLVNSMSIVIVSCESEGSAFRLFETLNNRGMALTAIDLMKNSLLQFASQRYNNGSESSEYQRIRDQWEFLLENVVHEINHPDRFFRHFMMSRKVPDINKSISSRKLYDEFNDTIRNRLDDSNISLTDYLDEMVEVSNTYIGLVESSVDISSGKQRQKINSRIRNLNDIKSSHSRTLILRSIEEFDDSSDLLEVLRLIESFMTRWRVADLTTGASLDRIFSDLCSNAFEKPDPVGEIRSKLKKEAPNDGEFKAKFASSNFKRNAMTRYILDTIEREHYSSGGGKTQDRTSVDIEHIAPQAAFKYDKYAPWEGVLNVDEAEYDNGYRNRIGNLTLLEERLNEEASDNPFEEKKNKYKLSDFEMTDYIRTNYDEWNTTTIEERSNDLAEIAVEVWSFD